MFTRGIGRGVGNGRGSGDTSVGPGSGFVGGGDSSNCQNNMGSFGRGGRGNSSFGVGTQPGVGDPSFGQVGGDSSFGRGGRVNSYDTGSVPARGIGRGSGNGRGGGDASVGTGTGLSGGAGNFSNDQNSMESSFGRSRGGRGNSSSGAGGADLSFGQVGGGGRGNSSYDAGSVPARGIGRGSGNGRGGGDTGLSVGARDSSNGQNNMGSSFGRGGRGNSSFDAGGPDPSFGRAGGNSSGGRSFFATGSNSVEVQQNAPNANENNSYFNRENVTTEDAVNCTTVSQVVNNNGVQNSDEKPINRGFALRERLVDDLSWTEFNMDPILKENITVKSNYIRPRKIQKHVIPYVLSGYDLKGHSETGSGKTGAFLIPIIQKILADPSSQRQPSEIAAPFALVLSPTRELCLQIYDQCRKFANGTFVKITRAYGQFNFGVNLGQLKEGCDILIATTGRLMHLIKDKHIDLSELKYFVLDEADRMLENNFLTSVREIIESPNFPPKEKRQTMIFSATFPPEIEELAYEILRSDFVTASNNKPVSANNRVKQSFLNVESEKMECLKEMLDKEVKTAAEKNPENPKPRRTLVFVETRRDADRLAVYLNENGIKSLTLNGERRQSEREMALRKFDRGFIDVLVATDVCARGIDIKGLEHVINYDLPQDAVTYVHRIGRTGRLVTGYSTSFVDLKKNANLIPELIKILQSSSTPIPQFMAGYTANESATYVPYNQKKQISTGFENGVQNYQNGFDSGDNTNDVWNNNEPQVEPFIDTALVKNTPVVNTAPAQSIERTSDYWASAIKQPVKSSFVQNGAKPMVQTHVAPIAQARVVPVAQTYVAPVAQTRIVPEAQSGAQENTDWDNNDNWEDIDNSWA
uniref:RNA helicase n=1 Tax=Meloidogyne javanica TaxID=6303 RepID=A0A915M3H9_MELJA